VGEVARLAAAAQHERVHGSQRRGRLPVLEVGDDARDAAQLGLAHQVAVGAQQHRHRADAVERRRDRQRAGAVVHQQPDVLALAHADGQQAADDVVDALLHRAVRARAVLEEEEHVARGAAGLLVEQEA
jgi:hypothetical protein